MISASENIGRDVPIQESTETFSCGILEGTIFQSLGSGVNSWISSIQAPRILIQLA
jgi:hypothetical protein